MKWVKAFVFLICLALSCSACEATNSSATSSSSLAESSSSSSSSVPPSFTPSPTESTYTTDRTTDETSGSSKRTETQDSISPAFMCRGWHESPVVGSGYSTRFFFGPDGVFYYAASEMVGAERIKYMEGEWLLENETMFLTVKRKIVLEGGTEVDGWGSMINDIEGGEYVKYDLDSHEYEYIELAIQIADALTGGGEFFLDTDSDCISIIMGEDQYWSSIDGTAENYGGVTYVDLLMFWDLEWKRS